MTQPTQPNLEPSPEQEPIIPPVYLLALAAIGFFVALIAWVSQPIFGVVGFAGLGIGILALLAWILLAPQQALAVVSGRTARFGGASLFVTLLLIVAMVGIYSVVRNASARVDLTESNDFSLTPESRQAISALGADPTLPNVEIIVFYGATAGVQRDLSEPLFEDYVSASGGKISYRYVDPDTSPQIAQLYNITRSGQAVVLLQGETTSENAQLLDFVSQESITNAILRVAAAGEFVAYFLTVTDGIDAGATFVRNNLIEVFDWTIEDVSLVQLLSAESDVQLIDPNRDGSVLVIPGGSAVLSDVELTLVTDYLAQGGDLILFAGSNFNDENVSLATGEALNAYLWENFGVRFRNDIVLDPALSFQSALVPVTVDLSQTSPITAGFSAAGQAGVVFELPPSIEISATPPDGLVILPLARTSETSYSKDDLPALLASEDASRTEGDAAGPFNLGVSVENPATGARVVLWSSTSVLADDYAQFTDRGVLNALVALGSFTWATDFDSFFNTVNIVQPARPQDQPIFADAATLGTINLVVVGILPFGVLLIGVYVWWSSRERARSN